MSFDYSKLLAPALETEFKPTPETPDGEGLKLSLNLDRITMEFLDEVEQAMKETINLFGSKTADKKSKKQSGKSEFKPGSEMSNFLFQINDMRSDIEYKARVLGGRRGSDNPNDRLIRDWNLERNGEAVPVSFESISGMHKNVIDKLYYFCTQAQLPTKEEKKTSLTT